MWCMPTMARIAIASTVQANGYTRVGTPWIRALTTDVVVAVGHTKDLNNG